MGERVALWSLEDGAYAEFHVGPAAQAWPIPDGLPPATALSALVQGLTAEFLVRRACPPKGGRVLVHAAAGGVGEWLVFLLGKRGVDVVGVASSPEKRAAVVAAGAAEAIEGTPEAVAALLPSIDVIYHCVGALFDGGLAKLAPMGTVLVFGGADGVMPPPVEIGRLMAGSLTLGAFGLQAAILREEDGGLAAFRELLASGFTPASQSFPLAEAAAAHRAIAARQTQSKVLLTL